MTSPWKRILIGTSYFADRAAAIRYYKPYHHASTEHAVDAKLKAGEIHLGLPPGYRPDDVILIDGGTRYAILEQ